MKALARVVYRESVGGTRIVADSTPENPIALEDGIVWIGRLWDGPTGIPLSRCLELVAERREALPTAADILRRPASTIMPRDASNGTEGWNWRRPWRWRT